MKPHDQKRGLLLAAASTLSLFAALCCGSPAQAAQAPVPLVSDPGLATDPAVSADGRWLAFASDRGGSGFLHLWVRPFDGGEARQLTEGANDDREPVFSPDGSMLAYRGEANGGGVYLIPVEAGRLRRPQLLAQGGRRQRFSPDGRRIVYWAANPQPSMFVIDVAGGPAQRIHAEFHSVQEAVWSPDGKLLVFRACRDASIESCDWWVSPVEGRSPIATGAAKLFQQHHLGGEPSPELWLSPETAIVFTAKTGDKT